MRNEEKNEFPHEERGIFEECPNLILGYISPVQIELQEHECFQIVKLELC